MKYEIEGSRLSDIGDAIREKLGGSSAYTVAQMPDAIASISGGGGSATLIDKSISTNGTYNASLDSADGYKKVVVSVANSYAAGDEGKVVSSGALVAQTARESTITTNGTYETTTNNAVTVNVPNTYAAGDEGKVVSSGALVAQTARSSDITVNGTYDTTTNNSVTVEVPTGTTPTGTINITQNGTTDVTQYASASVSVPNTYASGDEGKVVSSGALVEQTARSSSITTNGTYDTTTNNAVTVNVPNTYAAGDEGKVVSSGALVAQTARSSDITVNGTYDTTTNNSVTVAVPEGATVYSGTTAPDNSVGSNGDIYYLLTQNYRWFRMTITKTRTANSGCRMHRLTIAGYDSGDHITYPYVYSDKVLVYATGSLHSSAYKASNLITYQADDWWSDANPSNNNPVIVYVDMDKYLIPPDASWQYFMGADADSDPVSFTIDLSMDRNTWVAAETVSDLVVTHADYNVGYSGTLNAANQDYRIQAVYLKRNGAWVNTDGLAYS